MFHFSVSFLTSLWLGLSLRVHTKIKWKSRAANRNDCRAAVCRLEITAMPERYSIYFSLVNIYVQKEKCVCSAFLEDKWSNACSGIDFHLVFCFSGTAKGTLSVACLGRSFHVIGTMFGAHQVHLLWKEVVTH